VNFDENFKIYSKEVLVPNLPELCR